MCLIVAKPSEARMDSEVLRSAFMTNKDSIGVAVRVDSGIIIKKLVRPSWVEHSELLQWLSQFDDCPILIHYRYATHGAVNHDNAHPYKMHHCAIAHNGIISGFGCDKVSDSRHFLSKHVKSIRDVQRLEQFEGLIGASRLCAMLPGGDFTYANHRLGNIHDGCWYSNANHFDYYGATNYRHWDTSLPYGGSATTDTPILTLAKGGREPVKWAWFDPKLHSWERSIIEYLGRDPAHKSQRFKLNHDSEYDDLVSAVQIENGVEVAIAFPNK